MRSAFQALSGLGRPRLDYAPVLSCPSAANLEGKSTPPAVSEPSAVLAISGLRCIAPPDPRRGSMPVGLRVRGAAARGQPFRALSRPPRTNEYAATAPGAAEATSCSARYPLVATTWFSWGRQPTLLSMPTDLICCVPDGFGVFHFTGIDQLPE